MDKVATCCISHQRCAQSNRFLTVPFPIFSLIQIHHIHVKASYLRGSFHSSADVLSRDSPGLNWSIKAPQFPTPHISLGCPSDRPVSRLHSNCLPLFLTCLTKIAAGTPDPLATGVGTSFWLSLHLQPLKLHEWKFWENIAHVSDN